ncbi:MAG: trehalose-phosphatase [Candidatus Omnitrophota bacterium]|nr:MAG: trehalose-phosphatase [Candidatus Omnitrophota bacterium]
MEKDFLKSVVFDLDGVITKTAILHFESWKSVFDEYLHLRADRDKESFREFTHKYDYLPYVDGKPRYKGVESFLASRGISLPFGNSSDSPDRETICGIGNRKNQKFLELLKTKKPQIYTSTIQLANKLKQEGVRVGVASSSKNCEYILESAQIKDLFETIVDGRVSAQLKLKGKPEADIFVKAACNMQALPAHSVVVEDALAGVEAGRNGGFGLVVGIAREGVPLELLRNGADVAVSDLSCLHIGWIQKWFQKIPHSLFSFWDGAPEQILTLTSRIERSQNDLFLNPHYFRSGKSVFFGEKRPVFFLDYDGTLTPIVERPELAVISSDMKKTLERMCKHFTVAIVSGRLREDVQNLVGIEGIFYAGSHGFDISGPDFSFVLPEAQEAIPLIAQAIKTLKRNLESIKGVLIEEKKFSVAVHYRLADQSKVPQVRDFVESVVKDNPRLRIMQGKKVFEILPALDWNKGKATRGIMRALRMKWANSSVIYIGDDTTDEDVFRVIRTRGTGILVAKDKKISAADFRVMNPGEVKKIFEMVLEKC